MAGSSHDRAQGAIEQPAARTRSRIGWIIAAGLAVVLGAVAIFAGLRLSRNPDTVWQEARAAFEARRFDIVAQKLDELARLRQPTELDWLLRGELAIARGNTEEAVKDLDRVPDGNVMASQARLHQGQLELRRGRLRDAERYFLAALKLDPSMIQPRRELVFIYGMQLRRKEVGQQFRALSERTKLTYQDVFNWCLTRGVVWDPIEWAQDLAAFVKADPTDRASRLAWAEALRQLGRLDEAEQALRPLGDADADARVARVHIALDRNDPSRAEALLAEGPENHPELARLRGRLAFNRQDHAAALRQFQLAYAADPENRDTVMSLGQALRANGREAEAKPLLEAARRQDVLEALLQRAAADKQQKDMKLVLQLGKACEDVGRLPEARAWYRVVIDRDPLNQEAQQGLYRVEHREG